MLDIAFDNSYARLPEGFWTPQPPTPVAAPRLLQLNEPLARDLGLDPAELCSPEGVAMLAGNNFPANAAAIATAYAGHQFGHFVPQLGDGRALLLGEVVGRDGRRRDLQLKGSGPTPFSRNGDGRAALGPVLREYLVSEAMHALGIPTTRALSAISTGEYVFRDAALPGAVLCRVAASHIRVGTFQFFAARGDTDAVRALAAHAIARHHPQAAQAENPHLALLEAVITAQAKLVARWLLVGFVHGVMNTDNCSVAGETIDYGPCAFLDRYDPATVFSSIDQTGRYAYGMQPRIALWNCTRLAESLLPLLGADEDSAIAVAQAALGAFGPQFDAAHLAGLRQKLGLATAQEGDAALARDLLERMAEGRADFTQTFRRLADLADGSGPGPRDLFLDPHGFDGWLPAWQARLATEQAPPEARAALMRANNPATIPRNHLVEAALEAAVQHDNLAPFQALLDASTHPFEDRPGFGPPLAPAEGYRTFCGT